jgi:hypothetical protein
MDRLPGPSPATAGNRPDRWPWALDREPLAALVATALEHDPARTRAHACTEAVRPSALALLGLVGPLHQTGAARGKEDASRADRIHGRPGRTALHGRSHTLVHSPSTRVHTTPFNAPRTFSARFAQSLRRPLRGLPRGPRAVGIFAAPRPRRGACILAPTPPLPGGGAFARSCPTTTSLTHGGLSVPPSEPPCPSPCGSSGWPRSTCDAGTARRSSSPRPMTSASASSDASAGS